MIYRLNNLSHRIFRFVVLFSTLKIGNHALHLFWFLDPALPLASLSGLPPSLAAPSSPDPLASLF